MESHSRHYIFSLITFVLFITTISTTLSLPLDFSYGQEQFTKYHDPKGMFTIQYPNNWDKKENQSGGVSFIAPETSTVFAINIQNIRQLEEIYNREISSLEQFADRNCTRYTEVGLVSTYSQGIKFYFVR